MLYTHGLPCSFGASVAVDTDPVWEHTVPNLGQGSRGGETLGDCVLGRLPGGVEREKGREQLAGEVPASLLLFI